MRAGLRGGLCMYAGEEWSWRYSIVTLSTPCSRPPLSDCGPSCFQKKDLPDLRAGEEFRWPCLVLSDHGLCSGVRDGEICSGYRGSSNGGQCSYIHCMFIAKAVCM